MEPSEKSQKAMSLRRLCLMSATSTNDAMVEFIEKHHEVLSQFRIIAPYMVLDRVRDLLGENADFAEAVEVNFMGGDAQVSTHIVTHDVGAAFIFRDPIGTSAAACDCDALLRLINVHNIMNATNPASADMLVKVLAEGLKAPPNKVGEILPSFVSSLESPAVAAYVAKQTAVIASHSAGGGGGRTTQVELPTFADTSEMKAALLSPASLREDEEEEEAKPSSGGLKKNLGKLRVAGKMAGKLAVDLGDAKARETARRSQRVTMATQMRCLALISHNNMKGAMKAFVLRHQDVLKSFRLTGTNSTMTMLKSVLGTDGVAYGPTCSSGPLGGDAEVGALMTVEDLGGMFFFTDPLDPHPHATDVSALIRMCDLNNLMHASNPTTGDALVRVLKDGLVNRKLLPTFHTTDVSPAVKWHTDDKNGALYDNAKRYGRVSTADKKELIVRAMSAAKNLTPKADEPGWSPLAIGAAAAAAGAAAAAFGFSLALVLLRPRP